MSTTPTRECAVWYFRYGTVLYELCSDEHEAAAFALGLLDSGEGAVAGVQFDDGTYLDRDDWPAYKAAEEREDQLDSERAVTPKPATIWVGAPWAPSRPVRIRADAPSWLGDDTEHGRG